MSDIKNMNEIEERLTVLLVKEQQIDEQIAKLEKRKERIGKEIDELDPMVQEEDPEDSIFNNKIGMFIMILLLINIVMLIDEWCGYPIRSALLQLF